MKAAAMPDNTVILTTLNEAWAAPNSIIDLFLESFRIGERIRWLPNHLVIVSLDQKAFARCMVIHSHCFSLVTEGVDFSREAYFMTPDYLKMMWRRIDFLRSVLEMGYNFVFTVTGGLDHKGRLFGAGSLAQSIMSYDSGVSSTSTSQIDRHAIDTRLEEMHEQLENEREERRQLHEQVQVLEQEREERRQLHEQVQAQQKLIEQLISLSSQSSGHALPSP